MRLAACLVLMLWWAQPAEAACSGSSPTLTVTGLMQTDFTDCLTAAVDGDTILLPGGLVTFTSQVSWTNKSISVIGTQPTLTITSMSAANPTVVTTSGSHGLEDDQVVSIVGTSGTGSLTVNGHAYRINVTAATTFELLNVDLSGGGTTGGSAIANATANLCNVSMQTTYSCWTRGGTILLITTKATGNTPAGYTRLSGVGIIPTGGTGCGTYSAGGLTIAGSSANFRLDHSTLESTSCGGAVSGSLTSGYVRGVADHNSFMIHTQNSHSWVTLHGSWESTGNYGDKSWSVADTMGTANLMILEDNVGQSTDANINWNMDEHTGSRTLWRYNRFYNTLYGDHGLDTSGRPRGAFSAEVYRNFFSYQLTSVPSVIGLRSGHGMIFQNTAIGNMTRVSDLVNYRSNGDNRRWYPWGECGATTTAESMTITNSGVTATINDAAHNFDSSSTTVPKGWVTVTGANEAPYNGTFKVTYINSSSVKYTMLSDPGGNATGSYKYYSPYDQNTDDTGRNCMDQPGMGTGTLISGDVESGTNPGPVADIAQALVPIVNFRNTDDGTLSAMAANAGNAANILANTHYYNEHTTFNCTTNNGVGVGTAATMNALSGCTGTPYFWVTDEGEWDASNAGADGRLYKWDGDSWELHYTPYAYPAELAEDAQADTTPPVVTITDPTSAATFGTGVSPLTTLAGTCTDDVTVSSVTWSSNRGGSGSATGTTSWSVASITLQAGDNVITVTCTDSSSNTHQDALTVSFGAAPYSINLRRIRRP